MSFQPYSKVTCLKDAKYRVFKYYSFVLFVYTPETFDQRIHDDFLKKIESSEFIFSTQIVNEGKVQVKYLFSTKSVKNERKFCLKLGEEWKFQRCSNPDSMLNTMKREIKILVSLKS